MTTLTPNTPEALAHSQKLLALIQDEIASAHGHISFARYMDLALYAPGLGYYSAGSQKLGRSGDFITAPEISPLFAQCIAQQCLQVRRELSSLDILEFGAGSGKFAADLLEALEQENSLPEHYFILEVSADLKARQRTTLETRCPHLLARITWLDALPTAGIRGVIFANEVMDAMPLSLFRIIDNTVQERCVTSNNNQLQFTDKPPQADLLHAIEQLALSPDLPQPYESEINLNLPAWIQALSAALKQGLILLSDYGYGRKEYYHRDRQTGTLMCHYQHQRHADPLILVGLQDITAHVDFTAVIEAAVDADLSLAGYTTQAAFLFACGLLEMAEKNTLSPAALYQQNQAIKLLTLPSQMGEIIKVIGLSKQLTEPLIGFALHDRRRDL